MLNVMQMSDLLTYQKNMPDGREKDLLNHLLWEYGKYTECGTIEDCQQRKEWMAMSIDDIRKNFIQTVKGMRQEVEYIREDAQAPGKRGRPMKKSDGFTMEAPYPLGMKFYVLMHGYVEEQVVVGYQFRNGKVYLISDYGDNWEIGVDAWLTSQEAKDYQLEEIRKYNERRAANEAADQKK